MDDGSQRRENFRISYPLGAGAIATIGGEKYKVVDVAAAGLRILAGDKKTKFIGKFSEFQIQILMACGVSVNVIGKFFRNLDDDIVFRLTLHVPANVIHQEQIFMRNNYPTF